MFIGARCLNISSVPPTTPIPCWGPGFTLAASPSLCSCTIRHKSRPSQLTATAVCTLWANISSCVPALYCPNSHPRPPLTCVTLERMGNHGSAYQELPQLFVGPDPALSLVADMHHWAHLQLAQPSVHLHAPDQTSVTGFHLCMCHGNSLQPWEWRLTARTPTATLAVDHCPCFWPWPLLLHMSATSPCHYTSSATGPAAECVHTTTQATPLLALVLADGSGGVLEDSNSPCSH